MEETKILIIEDEQKIADTLNVGLTENGYHVEVAYDGRIGERLFFAHDFNLVILDINLPGINGYELTKIIRAYNTHIPIIMLTSLSTLNDKIEGYDAGTDDYIVKPFEFRNCWLKYGYCLNAPSPAGAGGSNLLKAADLVMNLDSKEVKRGNDVINLTAKEFQLLEYLLRNKNKVVSRAAIAVNVWDIDFDTNTNIIDVYISYLRNKIDKPYEQKLIQTHVGMGYILKENER